MYIYIYIYIYIINIITSGVQVHISIANQYYAGSTNRVCYRCRLADRYRWQREHHIPIDRPIAIYR